MNRPFRLLVTGSRGWSDTDRLRVELDAMALFAVGADATELVVVHGACYPATDRPTGRRPHESADWLAHLWVTLLDHPLPVRPEPHPVNWTARCRPQCHSGHRRGPVGRSICPAVGNYRNQLMVDLGADQGLAFLLDRSVGTRDCIGRMNQAGIPVRRVEATTPSPIHKH